MLNFIKKKVKDALRKHDKTLVYTPQKRVHGVDHPDCFSHDLKQVIRKPDPVCLDVGANKGQTIDLLLRTFPNPAIHSFEPTPETFGYLKDRRFPEDVRIYNYAIGSQISFGELQIYDNALLNSFLDLTRDKMHRFSQVSRTDSIRVAVKTIDWFAENMNLEHIDLLKIDTQGFDLDVLNGSINCLNNGRIRAVLIELNFIALYHNQCDAIDIMRMLMSHGLRIVDFYEKERDGLTLGWCTALFLRD